MNKNKRNKNQRVKAHLYFEDLFQLIFSVSHFYFCTYTYIIVFHNLFIVPLGTQNKIKQK